MSTTTLAAALQEERDALLVANEKLTEQLKEANENLARAASREKNANRHLRRQAIAETLATEYQMYLQNTKCEFVRFSPPRSGAGSIIDSQRVEPAELLETHPEMGKWLHFCQEFARVGTIYDGGSFVVICTRPLGDQGPPFPPELTPEQKAMFAEAAAS